MITYRGHRSQLSIAKFLFIIVSFLIVPLVIAEEDKIYGAWNLICTEGGNIPSGYCTISQIVSTDPSGLKAVMGISVHIPPDSPVAIMDIRITPHAIFNAGIGFKVDHHDSYKLRMKECTRHVCLVSGRLNKTVLEQLLSGKMVEVVFFVRPKKQINVPISLDGFHNAFTSLNKLRN